MSEPLATVRRTDERGAGVIAVSGEIDLSNAETVEDEIRREFDAASRVVLDLTDVEYLDSIGIAMLARLYEGFPDMCAAAPKAGHAGRLLAMVSLAIPVYETRAEAVAAAERRPTGA